MKTKLLILSAFLITQSAVAEPRWWTEGGGPKEPRHHEIDDEFQQHRSNQKKSDSDGNQAKKVKAKDKQHSDRRHQSDKRQHQSHKRHHQANKHAKQHHGKQHHVNAHRKNNDWRSNDRKHPHHRPNQNKHKSKHYSHHNGHSDRHFQPNPSHRDHGHDGYGNRNWYEVASFRGRFASDVTRYLNVNEKVKALSIEGTKRSMYIRQAHALMGNGKWVRLRGLEGHVSRGQIIKHKLHRPRFVQEVVLDVEPTRLKRGYAKLLIKSAR